VAAPPQELASDRSWGASINFGQSIKLLIPKGGHGRPTLAASLTRTLALKLDTQFNLLFGSRRPDRNWRQSADEKSIPPSEARRWPMNSAGSKPTLASLIYDEPIPGAPYIKCRVGRLVVVVVIVAGSVYTIQWAPVQVGILAI